MGSPLGPTGIGTNQPLIVPKVQQLMIPATVARTDTVAKNIGALPAGVIIVEITILTSAGSNAGTTATLSLGSTSGAPTNIVNVQNVLVAAGTVIYPTSTLNPTVTFGNIISKTADTQLWGIYAETGTASTSGGPWTFLIGYVKVGATV